MIIRPFQVKNVSYTEVYTVSGSSQPQLKNFLKAKFPCKRLKPMEKQEVLSVEFRILKQNMEEMKIGKLITK